MENIQYRLVLADGNTIDVNVDNAEDIFEAAPEIEFGLKNAPGGADGDDDDDQEPEEASNG